MSDQASVPSHDFLKGATVFTLGIYAWKQPLLGRYFPGADFVHLPFGIDLKRFLRDYADALARAVEPCLLTWGALGATDIIAHARQAGWRVLYLEDGFIRSLLVSASRSPPLSLTIDSLAPYFDSRGPTDLERLLNDYDCPPELLERARRGLSAFVAGRFTKYDGGLDDGSVLGPRDGRRRVLVIGQVEEDQSIRLGSARFRTNNALVRAARAEHPDAEVIYKPHPDVLTGIRRRGSDPAEVAGIARLLTRPVSLARLFEEVDHVYTITSLAGFEALMRGLPVTTFGCPFYAGWGLTEDRQPTDRRRRRRRLEELFAIAYIVYPHYFDASSGERLDFEGCLALIERWRRDGVPARASDADLWRQPPAWQPVGPYGLLGWRHLLTPIVAAVVRRIGGESGASDYRANPIAFFRELAEPRYRLIGRLLYPFDS